MTETNRIEYKQELTEGLEKEVIAFMRQNSKKSSFQMWRKRMAGRQTKHNSLRSGSVARFKCNRQRAISMNKISKR